jgi:hypothetical protein
MTLPVRELPDSCILRLFRSEKEIIVREVLPAIDFHPSD